MHNMTKANLEAAFAGESQAHMRYLIYADRAEKDGYPNVARLFRAVAHAERLHATNHLRILGEIGKTADNLQHGFDGEVYEIDEMYPAFQAVAELQGEATAARSMYWAFEAEKVHAGLYEHARKAILNEQDVDLADVWVCGTCGWTVEGEPPDECPLCGAKRDRFVKF